MPPKDPIAREEWRRRLSEAARRRFEDPAERERTGAAQRGKTLSPEQRAKAAEQCRRNAEAQRGRMQSAETRAKISATLRRRFAADPDERARVSKAFRGRTHSEAARVKIREAHRRQFSDPESRERFAAAQRRRWTTSERARRSEELRRRARERGAATTLSLVEIEERAKKGPLSCWFGFGPNFYRRTYELAHGTPSDGMEIDHLCGNGRTAEQCCCNPAHLEAVTHTENVKRGPSPHFHCRHKVWPEWDQAAESSP